MLRLKGMQCGSSKGSTMCCLILRREFVLNALWMHAEDLLKAFCSFASFGAREVRCTTYP